MTWEFDILTRRQHPRQFEFHPKKEEIVLGTLGGYVYHVDVAAAFETGTKPIFYNLGCYGKAKSQTDSILGLCWLRNDGTRFVSGSSAGKILCGDVRPGFNGMVPGRSPSIITEFPSFDKLTSVHLNSQNDFMVASGYTTTVRIYDLETAKVIQDHVGIHSNHINISRFANHSPYLFSTSSFDGSAKTFDLRIQPQQPIYTMKCNSGVVMISYSPDDTYILASALDNEISQFLSVDGRKHTTFEVPRTGLDSNFTRAYYSSSGAYVYTGACEESFVSVVCASTGRLLARADCYPEERKHASLYVQSLRGSPVSDNRLCVLANYRDVPNRELVMITIPPAATSNKSYSMVTDQSCVVGQPVSLSSSTALQDVQGTSQQPTETARGLLEYTRQHALLSSPLCLPSPALAGDLSRLRAAALLVDRSLCVQLERKLQHNEDEDHGLDAMTLAASVSSGSDVLPGVGPGQGQLAQTVRLLVALHTGDGPLGDSSSGSSTDQLNIHNDGDVLLVMGNPDASPSSSSSSASSARDTTTAVAIHAAHSCILSARSGALRRMLKGAASSRSPSRTPPISCRFTVLDLTSLLPEGTGYLVPLVLDYMYCGDGPAAGSTRSSAGGGPGAGELMTALRKRCVLRCLLVNDEDGNNNNGPFGLHGSSSWSSSSSSTAGAQSSSWHSSSSGGSTGPGPSSPSPPSSGARRGSHDRSSVLLCGSRVDTEVDEDRRHLLDLIARMEALWTHPEVSRCMVRALRDLLSLATALEVPQLADKCEHLLVHMLAPATALDILVVAMQPSQQQQEQSIPSRRRNRHRLEQLLTHTVRYMSAHWDLITCAFPSLDLAHKKELDRGDGNDEAAAVNGLVPGLSSVLEVVRELASTGCALTRTSLRQLKMKGAWSRPRLINPTSTTRKEGEGSSDAGDKGLGAGRRPKLVAAGGGTGAGAVMTLVGNLGHWLGGRNGAESGDVEMEGEAQEEESDIDSVDDDDDEDDDDDDEGAGIADFNGQPVNEETLSDLEEEFGTLEDSRSPWTPPLNPRPPPMTTAAEPLFSLRALTTAAEQRLHSLHDAADTTSASESAAAAAAAESSNSAHSPPASRKTDTSLAFVPRPVHNVPLLRMSKYEAHCNVVVGKGTMLLLGGRNNYRYHCQSQIMALNTLTNSYRWDRIATTGYTMPTSLARHVALPLQAHRPRHVLCVGGRFGVKQGGTLSHNEHITGSRNNAGGTREKENECAQVLVLDALALSWSSPPVIARSKSDIRASPFSHHTAASVRRPNNVASLSQGMRGDGNSRSELLDMNARVRNAAVVLYPEDFNYPEEGDNSHGYHHRDCWQQPLAVGVYQSSPPADSSLPPPPLRDHSSSSSSALPLPPAHQASCPSTTPSSSSSSSSPMMPGRGGHQFRALLDMEMLLRAIDPNELTALAATTAAATEPPSSTEPRNDTPGQGLGGIGQVEGVQGEGEDDNGSSLSHHGLAMEEPTHGSDRSPSEPSLDDAYLGYAAGTELSFDQDYQGVDAQRTSQVTNSNMEGLENVPTGRLRRRPTPSSSASANSDTMAAQMAQRKERLRAGAAAALLDTYKNYTVTRATRSADCLARTRGAVSYKATTTATTSDGSSTTTAESSTTPSSSLDAMVVVFAGICIRQQILCQDVAVITVTTHATPADAASATSSPSPARNPPTYNPTLSYQWHRPEVYGRFPVHRADHAAAKLVLPCSLGGPRMLIHGGMGPGGIGYLSDLHSLRLGDGDVMEWESVVVTGEIPPGRGCHTLVNIPDPSLHPQTRPRGDLTASKAAASTSQAVVSGASMDVLLLFGGLVLMLNEDNPDGHGGLNNHHQMFNDVHCLRLEQAASATDASSLSAFTLHFRWTKVRIDGGVPPAPRSSHHCCVITDPTTTTTATGALPQLHDHHHSRHHRMIIFGGAVAGEATAHGVAKKSMLSDVHVLKIDTSVALPLPETGPGTTTRWRWQVPKCFINPFPHASSDTYTPSDIISRLMSPSSSALSSLPQSDGNNAMDDSSNKEAGGDGSGKGDSCTLSPDLLDLLLTCQSSSSSSQSTQLSLNSAVDVLPGRGDVTFVVHPAEGSDGDAPVHNDGTTDLDSVQNPGTVCFSAHRAIVRARSRMFKSLLSWEEQKQLQCGSSIADTNAMATATATTAAAGAALAAAGTATSAPVDLKLFDADPAAFASLLTYLYSDTLQVSGSEELSALMVQAHRYGLTHLECLSEAFLCRQAYVLHCEYHREQQQRRLRERPLDRGVDSMEVDGAVVDEDGGDEEEEEEEDPIVSLVSYAELYHLKVLKAICFALLLRHWPASPSPLPSSMPSAPCRGEDTTTEAFLQTLVQLQREGLGLGQDQSNGAPSAVVASSNVMSVVGVEDLDGAEEDHGLSSLSPELREELEQYRRTQRHAHLIDHHPLNQHAQEHMRLLLLAIDGYIAKDNEAKTKAANGASDASSSTGAMDQAEPAAAAPAAAPAAAAEPSAAGAAVNDTDTWGMAKWFATRMQSSMNA